jgi:hypothetical protein
MFAMELEVPANGSIHRNGRVEQAGAHPAAIVIVLIGKMRPTILPQD